MAEDLEIEFKQATVDLKKATDDVRNQAETTNTEIKNLGKVTEETKAAADKALAEMGGVTTRLTDIEQKMSRRSGDDLVEHKSIGQRFVEDEGVKAAIAEGGGWRGRVRVEVKNITSATTAGASGTTALVPAERVAMLRLPERPLMIRDLLAPGRTNSGAIDVVRETVFTNSAAAVAEGALKPQSDLTFTMNNQPVRTVAHWMKASRQILADAPQLQSYIDERLRYGLGYAEDYELLNGDGTGQHLTGLIPNATAYAAPAIIPAVASVTRIDELRLAMLQTTLSLFPATAIVLHPTDWAALELTKDTQGRYIFANPATGLSPPTMWGLPVAASMAMAAGNFLVGALRLAAQIFDREDATVMISSEDQDNFVKNMVTILAEERLLLAIYRPSALVYGAFV